MTGWRLGGKNAPRWLMAPATLEVKRTTRDDLELLQRTFGIDALPDTHPLHLLCRSDVDGVPLARRASSSTISLRMCELSRWYLVRVG